MRRLPHAMLAAGLGLVTVVLALAFGGSVRAAPAGSVITDCTESGLDAALSGGGNFSFNCGSSSIVIGLTHPFTVAQDTSLDGGAAMIFLDGGASTRIFVVNSGVNFKLANLSLEHGHSSGSDGGAIANHGNLTLEGVLIQDSTTDSSHSGGAVFSDGPLTMTNSQLNVNSAGSAGALFAHFGNAIVHISNSDFIGNQSVNTLTGVGGAIWVGAQAQAFISGGDIEDNMAQFGGAIFVTQGATLTVSAAGAPALINGNTASGAGGGIYDSIGSVTLTNVQLQGNQATSNSVDTFGGAIDDYQGSVLARDTSLISNTATYGGGLFVTQGTVALTGTQFIGNTALRQGGGLDGEANSVATLTDFVANGNKAQDGGGLFAGGGPFTLIGALFSDNAATHAGGAVNTGMSSGVLTLTNASLSQNMAPVGGGLYNGQTSRASLTNVRLSDNTASNGGGVDNAGTLVLSNATLDGNHAQYGGGLGNDSGASATLTGSTFSNNSAVNAGGGLFASSGWLTLGDDTFSGNSSVQGGGIYDVDNSVGLTHVTFSGNTAEANGGGALFTESAEVTFTISLSNTLLAAGGLGGDCAGAGVISHGYNLSSDNSCASFLAQAGDLNGTDPHLGPLGAHGGPTETQVPGAGSPAIDAIPNGANGCGLFSLRDQRGFARPFNGKCDIGAVETGYVTPALWLPLTRR